MHELFALGEPPEWDIENLGPHVGPFTGKSAFLSNFAVAPVIFRRTRYPTVENAYQAGKCARMSDRRQFQDCTPGQAKKYGRKVNIRPDWEELRVPLMWDLLLQKFVDENLARQLVDTRGLPIIELNTWGDTFWGVSEGRGHNVLGQLLMGVRAVIAEHRARW